MMNGTTVSTAGSILELIRRVGTTTRSQLADAAGLARSTIADRVEQSHLFGDGIGNLTQY
jgi:hypothetical protein